MSTADLQASASTCIVGCKLAHGFTLELFEGKDKRRKCVWKQTLNGMNASRIVGGYGLTDGVETGKMAEWLKRNAEHKAVQNGSIFMHSEVASARALAKERNAVVTGMEAIDPLNKDTQNRFRIDMDKEGEKAYRAQMASNPVRDRQLRE